MFQINHFVILDGVIVFVLVVVAAAYIPLRHLIIFIKNKKEILLKSLKYRYNTTDNTNGNYYGVADLFILNKMRMLNYFELKQKQ